MAQITVSEMVLEDLLLISDVNAHESKKLTLGDLSTFLLDEGFLTGSLHGTASYALFAATASYVGPHSSSYAPTASWALNVATSSYTLTSVTASYAITASYIATASYALVSLAQSVFSASFAGNAQTASFLAFDPTAPTGNGTASYALTASFVALSQTSASYALSASYAPYSDFAAQASNSYTANIANTASFVLTASYLAFDPTAPTGNGTASYAMFAANLIAQTIDYGVFSAITQSVSQSQLDFVTIQSSLGGVQATTVEVFGTAMIQFTSSASPTNGYIELFVVNRDSGHSQSIDASPVYWYGGGSAAISGTLKYPFTLCGTAELIGNYEFYVTASHGAFIENSRLTKFRVSSEADTVAVSSGEPMSFYTYPSNAILLYSSSFNPGVAYQGSSSQVIFSGSNDVTELLVPPNTLNYMYYTWTLSNLTKLTTTGNTSLIELQGVPAGIISMSVSSCNLPSLPDLSYTSLLYLDCSSNNLNGTPLLPVSMSYFKCSNNSNLTLPTSMPEGLRTFIGDNLFITHTPSYFPNTLQTMSLSNCNNLNSWNSPTLPSSLAYFDCNSSQLTVIPPIPTPCVYLNISNAQFVPNSIGNICAGLVTNGQSNGTFNFFNNPNSASAPGIAANIVTLASRGWTVIS